MSIIEQAKAELERINFGAEDTAVMVDILERFFGHWDSGGAVSAVQPILMRCISGLPLSPNSSPMPADLSAETQAALQVDQRARLVVRVQAARVGQHPDLRTRQALGLRTERRLRTTERGPVRAESHECDRARPKLFDLSGEALAAPDQLGARKLVGRSGAAVHQIGEPVSLMQQFRLLAGPQ